MYRRTPRTPSLHLYNPPNTTPTPTSGCTTISSTQFLQNPLKCHAPSKITTPYSIPLLYTCLSKSKFGIAKKNAKTSIITHTTLDAPLTCNKQIFSRFGTTENQPPRLEEFYKLVAKFHDEPFYISEQTTKESASKRILYFDLDFKFPIKPQNNPYLFPSYYIDLFNIIHETVSTHFQPPIRMLILSAGASPNQEKETCKVGFHLYFPSIIVNSTRAWNIRKEIINTLPPSPASNSWEDIIDKQIVLGPRSRLPFASKISKKGEEYFNEGRQYLYLCTQTNPSTFIQETNLINNPLELLRQTSLLLPYYQDPNQPLTPPSNRKRKTPSPDSSSSDPDPIDEPLPNENNASKKQSEVVTDTKVITMLTRIVKREFHPKLDVSTVYTNKRSIKNILYNSFLIECNTFCLNIISPPHQHNSKKSIVIINHHGRATFQCGCQCETTANRRYGRCSQFYASVNSTSFTFIRPSEQVALFGTRPDVSPIYNIPYKPKARSVTTFRDKENIVYSPTTFRFVSAIEEKHMKKTNSHSFIRIGDVNEFF
jgi:hypothetical protein